MNPSGFVYCTESISESGDGIRALSSGRGVYHETLMVLTYSICGEHVCIGRIAGQRLTGYLVRSQIYSVTKVSGWLNNGNSLGI